MKITNLPMTGSFSPNEFDHYEWERRGDDALVITKAAECENPHYDAYVIFPDGNICLKEMDKWNISVGAIDQDGGEQDLDSEYIDQFEPLLNHFFEKYDQPNPPIKA